MGSAPEDVLRMIEEKRRKAIELRKRKLEESKSVASNDFTNPNKLLTTTNPQEFLSKKPSQPLVVQTSNYFQNKNKNNLSKQIVANNTAFTQVKNKQKAAETTVNGSPNKLSTQQNKNCPKELSISTILEVGNRFSISVEYETEIIKILRSVNSKNYDPVTKKWSFAISDYHYIFSEIKKLKQFNIKFSDSIHEKVIKGLIAANENSKKQVDLIERLEPKFVDGLFDFQRGGIIFGIRHEGKCMIADDMGLGKTIQAIGLAKWYREDWPLIIVTPSSLRYQWVNALQRWVENLSKEDIFVVKNMKDLFPKVLITIASYDLMARMKSRFTVDSNRFYKMIILDESHYIKSDLAQRTSAVSIIAKSCKRIVLLSGTPALSKPIELFPQLNLLHGDLFPSKHAFGLRYCDAKQKSFFKGGRLITTWNYNGSKNLDELRIIMENIVMIRRLKKDVLNQLPHKMREMVLINVENLSDKEKNQLNSYKCQIKNSHSKNDKFSLAVSWFASSAIAKVHAVSEYLQEFLNSSDNKLILFCHHMTMMDGVEKLLIDAKIGHIRIDGSTPAISRQEACDAFQENPNFRVALLSLTACATGLNLTSATVVIFAETYWNPGILTQAEDRAHRIGQQSNVRVIYLVAKGTSDEIMWPLISKKLNILNKAGLSRDNFANTLNPLEQKEEQLLLDEFFNSLSNEDLELLSIN